MLSAPPRSLDSWLEICGEPPEHDTDHGEADEGGDSHSVTLEVASQAAIATDPGERPFDNPPFGQDLEARNVGSLHDLQLPCSCSPDNERHLLSGIATISKDAFDKREQSSCPAQQQEGTVTVLNVGGMNDNVQQEAQRVDQDVPLATLDLLTRVVA